MKQGIKPVPNRLKLVTENGKQNRYITPILDRFFRKFLTNNQVTLDNLTYTPCEQPIALP